MIKVALACIGRLENRYAIEFIEYYKKLEFDHIYIADNNRGDEEHFEEVLQPYIDDGYVTIYDYRDIDAIQGKAYEEMYYRISDLYDWILFVDFDEYLTLVDFNNIQGFLSQKKFNNFNQILFPWRYYTDNNLIYDDGRGCLERFTEISTKGIDFINETFNGKIETKCMVRTKLSGMMSLVHIFHDKKLILFTTTCDANGNDLTEEIYHKEGYMTYYLDIYQNPDYNYAYIKHFTTKTIDEWVNNKRIRGTADRSINNFLDYDQQFTLFFRINEMTPEKRQYLIDHNIDVNSIKCD